MMKSRLPLALALCGFVGFGIVSVAQLASAQQTSTSTQAAHSEDDDRKPSASDRAAFAEARLAALHAGLALTPDQEKLWPPVESALRETVKTLVAQHKQMREGERPSDLVGWIKRMSTNQLARGEALKKLADAAAPLYATLSEEQKERIPLLLRAMRPHFMHHGFSWGEREHDEHGWGWRRHADQEHHGKNHEHDEDDGDDDGDE
jgi:zinc resistance-associated protein